MEEYQPPMKMKQLSADLNRFQVVDRNLSSRQAALKQYCDRMPDTKPALIAAKMSHLSVSELNQNFDYITKHARHFGKYWYWCFMKRKETK